MHEALAELRVPQVLQVNLQFRKFTLKVTGGV